MSGNLKIQHMSLLTLKTTKLIGPKGQTFIGGITGGLLLSGNLVRGREWYF